MLAFDTHAQPATQHRLITSLARDETEIQEAQRLRYKVFAEEMGASLPSANEGIDRDIFDKYCDHLLVRESESNRVVGTYRILPPDRAQKIGGYYSQTEFDLIRLLHLSDRMIEVGRSCVHRDYRDGATITHLWSGLAQYISRNGYEYLIGCASIGMADGGHVAASVYRKLHRAYAAPIEYSVFPRNPLPLHALNQYLDAPIPPLIKGYLQLGAYICGEPTWDAEFNTADLLILLPMSRLSSRYAKHFLKTSELFLKMQPGKPYLHG
ncbi:GNAT family N-acetyltransferase [Candidatus Ferrigenium straubiae]|jgi:putative hemolysin|uniref:GNAT family N-acetyltransferase n=1 Tax=Candidatus Ferrigenium straubiae TaxID=2919506 RepID=UPI003F4ABB14